MECPDAQPVPAFFGAHESDTTLYLPRREEQGDTPSFRWSGASGGEVRRLARV